MKERYPQVNIRQGRDKAIRRYHPWIFSGSIDSAERDLKEGEVVRIVDAQGGFLGLGHCASGSLAIKMLSFQDEEIEQTWFTNKIQMAVARKSALGFPSKSTNAFRLVHGEGDALPGLIVDVYNGVAVVQFHSVGMELSKDWIVEALIKSGYENVLLKAVDKRNSNVVAGTVKERLTILENNLKFHVDAVGGQKTGFFLDQRDNRALLQLYAKNKRVLNVFSYTGGFSISALMGGAEYCLSVDSAQKALDLAQENAVLNNVSDKHQILKVDAVPYLDKLTETFDIIVLDPPAFAKHKSARHNAIQAYRRINESAIRKVKRGGMLFTFSCSQVIDLQLFNDTVASAAINVGRSARIVHHMRQPSDHAVSIFHPEGEYLKGLVLQID